MADRIPGGDADRKTARRDALIRRAGGKPTTPSYGTPINKSQKPPVGVNGLTPKQKFTPFQKGN